MCRGLARCIQHEVDHLDGVLFTQRTKKIKNKDAKLIPKSNQKMPTLHFSKDDRVDHFHIFGYFKEFTDKKHDNTLGINCCKKLIRKLKWVRNQ